MNIQELYNALERHDWFYSYSDDHSVWQRGVASMAKLEQAARDIPNGIRLLEDFAGHHFSGEPWKTAKKPRPKLEDYCAPVP